MFSSFPSLPILLADAELPFQDSTTGQCIPDGGCRASGGRLRNNRDGSSTCVCPSPFIVSPTSGVCVLPPSARARAARRARSQIALDYPSVEGDDHLKCPDGERACPIGGSTGYECLDVTSTLDSCTFSLVASNAFGFRLSRRWMPWRSFSRQLLDSSWSCRCHLPRVSMCNR